MVVYISVIILKMFFVISSPEESKCSQYLEVAVDSLCDMDLCVTLSFSLLILFCAISKRGLCVYVCVCAYACMSLWLVLTERTSAVQPSSASSFALFPSSPRCYYASISL